MENIHTDSIRRSLELNPEELDDMISYLPMMFSWLKETTEPKSFCPLLLSASQEDRYGTHAMLVSFALQDLSEKRIESSRFELNQVFDSFGNKIWFGCVLKILEDAATPMIPEDVKLELLNSSISSRRDIQRINKILRDKVPFVRHAILGEFCGLINRTWNTGLKSQFNKQMVAEVLGPIILLDETLLYEKGERFRASAVTLFRTIVENSGVMFDLARVSMKVIPPGFDRANIFHPTQHLRLFFELRDKKCLPIVDPLLLYYDFVDVAKGIYMKYSMLPEGWRDELVSLQKAGNLKMSWFHQKKVIFMNCTTIRFPMVSTGPFYYDLGYVHKIDTENIVDEILTSEKEYFENLSLFTNTYTISLNGISKGTVGKGAKDALGLSDNQVEYLFGKRLKNVLQLVGKMLIKLEILCIVREPISDVHKIGRAGVVSDVFVSMIEEIRAVYLPYNKYYAQAAGVLSKAEKDLELCQVKSIKGSSPVASRRNFEFNKHLNFIELWEEVSQLNMKLKGQRIANMLIKPVKRFTNYVLLFSRLEKQVKSDLGEGHLTFQKVHYAHLAMSDLTFKINDEINRYNEIMMRKFGDVAGSGDIM